MDSQQSLLVKMELIPYLSILQMKDRGFFLFFLYNGPIVTKQKKNYQQACKHYKKVFQESGGLDQAVIDRRTDQDDEGNEKLQDREVEKARLIGPA